MGAEEIRNLVCKSQQPHQENLSISLIECKRCAAGIRLKDLYAAAAVPGRTYRNAKSGRHSMRYSTLLRLKVALDELVDHQRRQHAIGGAA